MSKRKKQLGRPRHDQPRWPFPLKPDGSGVTMTAHRCGQWCKKIKGRVYYFGRWDDPQGAMRKYEQQVPYLLKGQLPPGVQTVAGRTTVTAITELYIETVARKVAAGELAPRTLNRYSRICRILVEQLGANKFCRDLGPYDFDRLREHLGERMSPSTVQQMVTIMKSIFDFAWQSELLLNQVRFGILFKAPTGASIRKSQQSGAKRMLFERSEVMALIYKGKLKTLPAQQRQLRAMILLGINCGFGLADCSRMVVHQLKLQSDLGPHINMPRAKTYVDRFCPLWPETAAALQTIVDERTPAEDVHEVFTTEDGHGYMKTTVAKTHGKVPVKYTYSDRISKRFRELKRQLIDRDIVQADLPRFYHLRHTFSTVADELGDDHAVARIMGHKLRGMAMIYVHRVNMARLKVVTDHVHDWLFEV